MQATYVRSVHALGDLPRDRKVEIAIAGRSNVGKSSLLNRLVGQRALAKVSQTPGKTRCLNFFMIEPDTGSPFYLVDLPGYGYAKVAKREREVWAGLIEKYLASPDRPQGLIALFDARREPTDDDRNWLAWLDEWQRPYLAVLTKCDKLSNSERADAIRRWTMHDGVPPLGTSAVTGEGIDRVWQWMMQVRKEKRSGVTRDV